MKYQKYYMKIYILIWNELHWRLKWRMDVVICPITSKDEWLSEMWNASLPWRQFLFMCCSWCFCYWCCCRRNSPTVTFLLQFPHKYISTNESIVRRMLIAFVDSFFSCLVVSLLWLVLLLYNLLLHQHLPVKRDKSGFIRMKTVGCYGSTL